MARDFALIGPRPRRDVVACRDGLETETTSHLVGCTPTLTPRVSRSANGNCFVNSHHHHRPSCALRLWIVRPILPVSVTFTKQAPQQLMLRNALVPDSLVDYDASYIVTLHDIRTRYINWINFSRHHHIETIYLFHPSFLILFVYFHVFACSV